MVQQPVILLFWATWCPYCKALMPHLQSIRL
ncbi:MAG: redoxin domain-containing protein, partial [Gammaproteobacteria bacterium]|nr:redoxin domain-containing protein [Gammaproteobacteria bacterium]